VKKTFTFELSNMLRTQNTRCARMGASRIHRCRLSGEAYFDRSLTADELTAVPPTEFHTQIVEGAFDIFALP
jgi:hypothetical protein